jgi:TDG/mug DNA glycosylase family protein
MVSEQHIVEDILEPGLHVVFCGTALGRASANAKAYYAHRRNVFWQTLHDVGLTTAGYPLAPSEYMRVLEFGIGLTDLCKSVFGNDSELARTAFNANALRKKIGDCQPAFLAFTSKKAGQVFCGRRATLGWQADPIDKTRIYILPSTSPSARWQWQEHRHHWQILADAVKWRT